LCSRFSAAFSSCPNAGNGNVIQRASKPNGRKKRLAFKKVAIQQRIGTISSSVNRKLAKLPGQEKLKIKRRVNLALVRCSGKALAAVDIKRKSTQRSRSGYVGLVVTGFRVPTSSGFHPTKGGD